MDLTADDICKIIKIGHECGASDIKITGKNVHICYSGTKSEDAPLTALPSQSEIDEQFTPISFTTSRIPKELEEEDDLAELAITDPLEYERKLAANELEDANGQESKDNR